MGWLVDALMRHEGADAGIGREAQARARPWMPDRAVIEAVEAIVFDLRLPQSARDYILAAFRDGPSRAVSNRRGNTTHCFHSRKMNNQLMLEGRRGEWAAAEVLEAAPDVVCFLAQPPGVSLAIRDPEGKTTTSTIYRPDFLEIRRNSIKVVQQRDLAVIALNAEERPHQWYRGDDHLWHYRAADEAFREVGLPHHVRPNDELPLAVVRNEVFLADYMRPDAPALPEESKERLRTYMRERRFSSFLQTICDCELSADDLNRAIVEGVVHFDLTADVLDDTQNAILFSDPATCKAYKLTQTGSVEAPLPLPGWLHLRPGSTLEYNGKTFQVILCGSRDILLQEPTGERKTLSVEAINRLHRLGDIAGDGFDTDRDRGLVEFSEGELERAAERLEAIDAIDTMIDGHDAIENSFGSKFSRKQIASFQRIVRGASTRVEALELLVDRFRDRGNRVPRVSNENRALGTQAINEKYNTKEGGTKKAAYARYEELCKQGTELNGLPVKPVSYTSFCLWVEKERSTKARKGKRAAYQEAEIPTYLDNSLPVHGVRPHEVCYIDHTDLNIGTKTPNAVKLGKPVFSVGRDGNSTNAKALYMSYDKPSARTVLMVLRDYIRRNGRLPKILAVDNGKEFHSKALEFFCWLFEIEIRWRPPGQPRGGAPVESLIGATEIEILAQAKGNTRILKDPRMMTKSVDPFRSTEWTLPALYFAFEYYLFDLRANRIAPALGVSPNEYETRRIAETGARSHVLVKLDEQTMLLTSPNPRQAYHVVDRRRGVFVDGDYYWHPELGLQPKGAKLEVRLEPWLCVVVYVRLRDRWVAAIRNDARRLGHRTYKEMEIVRREERRRSKNSAQKDTLSSSNSAKSRFLWDPTNFDRRISAQQEEMRYLYYMIGMGTAKKIAPEYFTDAPSSSKGSTPGQADSNAAACASSHADPRSAEAQPGSAGAGTSRGEAPASELDDEYEECTFPGYR